MCLAMPTRVIEIDDNGLATVELDGVQKKISLALIDGVEVGDYVIVHVGFALQKLDPVEAEKTLDLFREMADLVAAEDARQA
jgi:hydrogenase expression/formation protein HypC